tara:strand:+ start:1265 stop:2962 length:1698 start_codon:yes stop_codon:yes gene_type:complete
MANKVQVARSDSHTSTNYPTGSNLAYGELGWVNGSNRLFIGRATSDPSTGDGDPEPFEVRGRIATSTVPGAASFSSNDFALSAMDYANGTGNTLTIKALGVSNAQLAGSIANNKLANSSVSFGGVSLSLGGSDATPAFDLQDATGYPTSSLTGTITNAQLAGSIANSKLANSSVSFGGVTLSLGASDATPAFNLQDATGYPTSSLTGTITNAQLAGSIANGKLANSSVTIGATSTALGATSAGLTGLTDIDMTAADHTIFDGVGSNTLTLGASGTTIKIPGSLTVEGSTTSVATTNLEITDKAIQLGKGVDSIANSDGAGIYVDPTDNAADRNFLIDNSGTEWNTNLNIRAASFIGNVTGSSGSCTGNAATATSTSTLSGVATSTLVGRTDPGSGNHQELSPSNVRTLLNVADGANNYSLPAGSSSVRGGFKIGYTENGKNYPVEVDSEKMYVNVPWTDSNSLTTEQVQDIVGAMFTSNTETRISATYQDTDGTIDLVVDAFPTGDITGVYGGNGLTGSFSSGEATLHVGQGTGISVTANAVAIDNTVLTTSSTINGGQISWSGS